MGTIFKILVLCHFLGHFGSVTSDSCGSDPLQTKLTLLVDMKPLMDFLATPKQSEDSASAKYLYSKEDIPCSKPEDSCSLQKCCEEKTPKCNAGTKKCDCFDSTSNKFTGRPLIYLENSGKCGEKEAGCTICLGLDTLKRLGSDQGQGLEGNGSALALSTNRNQTSLMEIVGRDFRELTIYTVTQSVAGLYQSAVANFNYLYGGGLAASMQASISGFRGEIL